MDALIYFVVWAALIFLMLRFGCGAQVMGHGHHGAGNKNARRASGEMRWVPPETDVDPVCGKTVQTGNAKPSVFEGIVYYFCSRECRERFETAPDLYVGPSANEKLEERSHTHD